MNHCTNTSTAVQVFKIMESVAHPDPEWDAFLDSIAGAEFEQSSLWAVVKKEDGWKPYRFIFRDGEKIIGGYQILVKYKKPLGKYGYAVKGPTYLPEYHYLASEMAAHLLETARRMRCNFLITQPPYISAEVENYYENRNIIHERLLNIIEVSVVVELQNRTHDELLAGIKAKRRQNIRKAEKSGLTFSIGEYTDLECFFELMASTCTRIGTAPNPGTIHKLKKTWGLLSINDRIKLFFIENRGEKICGIITILFGNKVYLWKFGWSGKMSNYHPNEYLYWKILEWSLEHGYEACDFMDAPKKNLPEVSKRCSKIPVDNINGNSELKLSFGGSLIILPKVRIVFYNKYHILLYQLVSHLRRISPPQLIKLLKKRAAV